MRPTAVIYSSHDRCEYLHGEFIIKPALANPANPTLFHLSWSQRDLGAQRWDFGNFAHYYERFRDHGLEVDTLFFEEDAMTREKAEHVFERLRSSEVVVLGGGNTLRGMKRFREIGFRFFDDEKLFEKTLLERQAKNLVTAGFSAGADQLCEYLWGGLDLYPESPFGLGLARNVQVMLHYEPGQGGGIYQAAQRLPHVMAFGLPNDSGIGVHQGTLPSGNRWQVIWFIIDESWDRDCDAWHIKTRWGEKIQHFYADGRHWAFNGGDMMVRVMSPDSREHDAWILTNRGECLNYWTQGRVAFSGIEDLLNRY